MYNGCDCSEKKEELYRVRNIFRKAGAILLAVALGAEICPQQAFSAYGSEIVEDISDEIVLEDTGADDSQAEEIEVSEDTAEPFDGIMAEDALIVDEADEADPENEDGSGQDIIYETAELDDPLSVPDEIIPALNTGSGSTFPGRRSAIRRSPAAVGSALLADQLPDGARRIYNSKVDFYAVNHNTGEWTYYPLKTDYVFEGKVTADGKSYDKDDPATAAALDECKKKMMRDMQGAADAFKHDHPEVFWIRSPKSYSYGFMKKSEKTGEDGNKTATYYIAQITYTPVESFTGAGSLISQYQTGVQNALTQVRGMADAWNTDGAEHGSSEYTALLVRAADQYLSGRLYYDNAALSEAVANSAQKDVTVCDAQRIYTSAAAFVEPQGSLTNGVVCEGYAKALKVICDNLGIPCVCVAGLSDKSRFGSGHMWNLVQIGGIWYLTDPTWDDSGSQDHTESNRKYLLVSNYTNNSYLTSRVATGNLGGSTLDGITIFQYPPASGTCYETSHEAPAGAMEPADCVNAGHFEGTCEICSAQVEIDEKALGHDYREKVVEPNCTEGGYTLHICRRCGDSYHDNETPALGHDYVEIKYKYTAPTCTKDGSRTYICNRCGICRKVMIPKLGHDYQDEVTAPTCTESGYTTHTCSRSGDSYKDAETSALGHDYKSQITAPTCTARGFTTYTCRRCGSACKSDFRPAKGHQYSQVSCTAPACSRDGLRLYRCSVCGTSYRTRIPAAGHHYQVQVIAPTLYRQGYTHHVCSRCGASYNDSYTPMLLQKTNLRKVKALSRGRFRVTFRRTKKFSKYEIQYSTRQDFSDAVSKIVTRRKKSNSVTITGRKKQVYYVRVRALSGNQKGIWSKVRRVKTRKK